MFLLGMKLVKDNSVTPTRLCWELGLSWIRKDFFHVQKGDFYYLPNRDLMILFLSFSHPLTFLLGHLFKLFPLLFQLSFSLPLSSSTVTAQCQLTVLRTTDIPKTVR